MLRPFRLIFPAGGTNFRTLRFTSFTFCVILPTHASSGELDLCHAKRNEFLILDTIFCAILQFSNCQSRIDLMAIKELAIQDPFEVP
jgi:hypothetical protein